MESSPIPKGRILCTEDDCDTQEMLILMLQNCGYEVVCTASPAQTLALAREQQFDLFLFDNWMPEFDGVELALEIRKFNQTTPILFYSGAATDSDRQRAFNAGAHGYLVKPIGIEELISEVDRLIPVT